MLAIECELTKSAKKACVVASNAMPEGQIIPTRPVALINSRSSSANAA